MNTPLLEAESVSKSFGGGKRGRTKPVQALSSVSLALRPGQLMGLVGESGSGKSTLCRILIGIEQATSGRVLHNGQLVSKSAEWMSVRRDVQYMFQDSFGSLPEHMKVRDIVRDPLDIHRIGSAKERNEKVERYVELVGLRFQDLDNYPAVFSGGQRQRINIARALILEPSLVICDEIVSGLDVSVQAQVLNLLLDLHERLGVSYLFVSHDLRVVRYLCDEVTVMLKGSIVEQGDVQSVFDDPVHRYTQHLLNVVKTERAGPES